MQEQKLSGDVLDWKKIPLADDISLEKLEIFFGTLKDYEIYSMIMSYRNDLEKLAGMIRIPPEKLTTFITLLEPQLSPHLKTLIDAQDTQKEYPMGYPFVRKPPQSDTNQPDEDHENGSN